MVLYLVWPWYSFPISNVAVTLTTITYEPYRFSNQAGRKHSQGNFHLASVLVVCRVVVDQQVRAFAQLTSFAFDEKVPLQQKRIDLLNQYDIILYYIASQVRSRKSLNNQARYI